MGYWMNIILDSKGMPILTLPLYVLMVAHEEYLLHGWVQKSHSKLSATVLNTNIVEAMKIARSSLHGLLGTA